MTRGQQDGRKVLCKQTEVDFGTTPVSAGSFVISDEDVSVDSRIVGGIAYEAPTGKDLDEVDIDMIKVVFGPGDKQLTIYAKGLEGYLADKFKINYLIG